MWRSRSYSSRFFGPLTKDDRIVIHLHVIGTRRDIENSSFAIESWQFNYFYYDTKSTNQNFAKKNRRLIIDWLKIKRILLKSKGIDFRARILLNLNWAPESFPKRKLNCLMQTQFRRSLKFYPGLVQLVYPITSYEQNVGSFQSLLYNFTITLLRTFYVGVNVCTKKKIKGDSGQILHLPLLHALQTILYLFETI